MPDNCHRARTVTLLSGDQCCTWCERHRAECEARAVLAMPGKATRIEYLAGVTKRRGEAAGAALKALVLSVWKLKEGKL